MKKVLRRGTCHQGETTQMFEWLPYEEGIKTQVAHDALNG